MMPKLVESFRKFRKFRSSAKHELRMISVSGQSQGSADRKSADSFSPGDSVRRPNSVGIRFCEVKWENHVRLILAPSHTLENLNYSLIKILFSPEFTFFI